MKVSNARFESDLPYWQDYTPFLQQFVGRDFPVCEQLNALLADGLSSESGQTIRFVPSTQLADDAYEHRIYTTGQVSTRPDNWHDLFNAMVWMRFPRIKTAMNALHFHAYSQQSKGSRGPLRDALTLFDECGVIVFSNSMKILNSLAERRWSAAFQSEAFNNTVKLAVSGHAMLEKYLAPYKSMTAKALLIHVSSDFMALSRQKMLSSLDREIARQMRNGKLLTQPSCLSPLPLAGIPGWWPNDEQNDEFYDDPMVFRPPPANLVAAPVTGVRLECTYDPA